MENKSLPMSGDKENYKISIFPRHRYKPEMIRKEKAVIEAKGAFTRTRWIDQLVIILIYKAIERTGKKEKALKYGLRKMQALLNNKNREVGSVERQSRQLQQVIYEKDDELNQLNEELKETNHALSALARLLDNEKKTFEAEISQSVIVNILPIVKTLQKDMRLSAYTLELNLLESYIGSLLPNGIRNQGVFRNLTETEGQIATLIKKGMSSKKIAALLCISNETVRTHRKNIRKKLKIRNTKIDLRAYLNQNPIINL